MKSVPARGRHDFGLDLGQQTSGTPVLDLFAPLFSLHTPPVPLIRVLQSGEPIAPRHMDFAASIQAVLDEAMPPGNE
jgi:hypothetical protein